MRYQVPSDREDEVSSITTLSVDHSVDAEHARRHQGTKIQYHNFLQADDTILEEMYKDEDEDLEQGSESEATKQVDRQSSTTHSNQFHTGAHTGGPFLLNNSLGPRTVISDDKLSHGTDVDAPWWITFPIYFRDLGQRKRFYRYMITQHSVGSAVMTLFVPAWIATIIFIVSYLELITNYEIPVSYCVIGSLSFVLLGLLSLYHVKSVYHFEQKSHQLVNLNMHQYTSNFLTTFEEDLSRLGLVLWKDSISSGNIALSNEEQDRAVQQSLWFSFIFGIICIFTFAFYAYVNGKIADCHTKICIGAVPIRSFLAIWYVPLHLTYSTIISWESLVILEVLSKVALVVLFVTNMNPDVFINYEDLLIAALFVWAVWLVGLLYTYKKNVIIFLHRDILANVVSRQELM